MKHTQIVLTVVFLFILSACVTGDKTGKHYFFPKDSIAIKDGGNFLINNPRDKIVILYTPGARHNNRAEPCRYAASAPDILLSLKGKVMDGKEVVIHGFCSFVVGDLGAGLSM